MNNNTIAIALAALLVGGVAVAAFQNNRGDGPGARGIEYATVLDVKPINERQQLYADVIGSNAVRETSTSSTPHQVCNDVVVQERLPERDGNVGGTVAGAIIGGLVGNQIGGGNGKKLATAGGAVAGGYIGNRVDRNHVGGQVVNRTEQQCHTTTSTSQSSHVVGYEVTYQGRTFAQGSRFIAPADGFGMRRASPDLRRLLSLAQIGLEAADPANVAPHYEGARTLTAADGQTVATRALMVPMTGDSGVAIASALALMRAAGFIDYKNVDPRYGKTQMQVLIDTGASFVALSARLAVESR